MVERGHQHGAVGQPEQRLHPSVLGDVERGDRCASPVTLHDVYAAVTERYHHAVALGDGVERRDVRELGDRGVALLEIVECRHEHRVGESVRRPS